MNRRTFLQKSLAAAAVTLAAQGCAGPQSCDAVAMAAKGPQPRRPNIVLIMGDDMGYSDLGCYGGEIRTPNLDRLAAGGLRFTQFYNTARCCPTRASLLTGLYPHQAGIGHMMDDRGLPGYQGDLGANCRTIAEVLRPAGYGTYMAGKWHVTPNTSPDGPRRNWPLQRGFDRFYGTIHGAGSFYDPCTLTRDNTMIPPDSPDYYYTDAITASAARFIADHARTQPDRPFFLYAAYTAAHWPMHAREADVARQKGRYAAGWQALRRERYERMRRMGLLPKEWALSPDDSAPWDDLSPEMKAWHQRRMEVYAAMVEVMDDGIGRIVAALQAAGQLDRTLLVFLQDNGGCAEEYGSKGAVKPDPARPVTLKPMAPDELQRKMQPDVTRDGRPVRTGEGVMPGPPDTYVAYGREWANVSNTPFRMYKHWVHEGGVATPLIVHWPDGFSRRGEFERQPGHLIDLMATFADVAGAAYPADVDGRPVTPLEGRSLVPALAGRTIEREAIYWEHEGNRAVRQGRWKLVAKGAAGPWELYDMAADRSELKDLAADDPDRVRNMAALWDAWAKRANVLPWPWDGDDSRTAFSNQTHFELTGGDSLPRTRAPMVAGRPVRVAAAVEAKGPDGVIVAQGGTSLGWALYLAGGRAAFAVRSKGKGTFVVAPDPLPAGRADVGATLAADGTVTLTVGGRTVATGKADGPVASMPLDGLEVGRDDGGAVGPYAAPNVFKGRIEKVVIDVGP